MSSGPYYLGIDIGGTKCACVLGDSAGRIAARVQWPSRTERGPDTMINDVAAKARELIGKQRVLSAGVAIGGPVDARQGVILGPPNLPGWQKIALRDRLEAALSLPVRVEHDGAACALAEHRWGSLAGDPDRTLIYLTCGTGFGVGFVFGGRIHHGAGGGSPEIGHVRLLEEGPEGFGKRGSVEGVCAGSGLGRIASWRFPVRWPTPPQGSAIGAAAAAGDNDAREVVRLHGHYVGRVCAALVDTLRPDVIALGSLARYLGDGWLSEVRDVVRTEALPAAVAACRIGPAELGERLQDLSALVIAVTAEARPAAGTATASGRPDGD